MNNNIHWFPGHMKKAINQISEKLKMIDVVIEICDARIPFSSLNKQLENAIKDKPKLLIFSKCDLADENQIRLWEKYYQDKSYLTLAANLNNKNQIETIINKIQYLAKPKIDKLLKKGIKNYPIKTMIIGIPNVGKSTLINLLSKRKAAKVENKPGLTRSQQWIKIDQNIYLLDTPGILPTYYENEEIATKIALIGSIRQDIVPLDKLVNNLIDFLKEFYPNSLQNRYKIENIDIKNEDILKQICINRSFKKENDVYDFQKAKITLLNEFKDGLLGRVCLDRCDIDG